MIVIVTISAIVVFLVLAYLAYTFAYAPTAPIAKESELSFTRESVTPGEEGTAIQVLQDNLKDPIIVSRAYFTGSAEGDVGEFKAIDMSGSDGCLGISQYDGLHCFAHEEA
jgi:hypothetical protein